MKEERKLILKLGQMITDRVGVKVTVEDPEYWGLAEVLTDEMAEVCLSMKVRKPMTLEQIARKSGKDPERVQKLLDEMSVIGMIEYNWENADHHKQYVLPMFVPGCAEFMMMNDKQVEEHPILADFFENMSRLPLEKVTPMVPPGGSGIGMHVIPVEKAIPAKQESASVEHISHWLKKYQDKYAVGACSCRRQQRVRGEGCGEIEGDLCIGVGDMADYLVETEKAITSHRRKFWKFWSAPRETDLYIKSPILTGKIRSSPSATVHLVSAMHCVHLLVRLPVLLIFPYRAILRWRLRDAILTH